MKLNLEIVLNTTEVVGWRKWGLIAGTAFTGYALGTLLIGGLL